MFRASHKLKRKKKGVTKTLTRTYHNFYYCVGVCFQEEGTWYAHTSDGDAKVWSYLHWTKNFPLFHSTFATARGKQTENDINVIKIFTVRFISTILSRIASIGTTRRTATFTRKDNNLKTTEGDPKNNNDDDNHHILLSHILVTYLTSIPICTSTS